MAPEDTNLTSFALQPVGLMAKALRRLRRLPVIPILLLLLMTVTGVTADWIAPHDPINGDLSDRVLPPFWGGETTIEKLVVEEVELGQGYRQIALDVARKTKADVSLGDRLDVVIREGGTTKFLLGTDHLGRDMLSRIVHGARISLIIALVTLGVGGTLGVALGLVSGWYGGWLDELIMAPGGRHSVVAPYSGGLGRSSSGGPVLGDHCRSPVSLDMASIRTNDAGRSAANQDNGLRCDGSSVRGFLPCASCSYTSSREPSRP